MTTGVYAKKDLEIAISKHFKLIHYKNENIYGSKLYKDDKLIAVVERMIGDKIKAISLSSLYNLLP